MSDDELKLTVICPTCQNQFGKWRPRCPACGTPYHAPASFNVARVQERKRRDPVARVAKQEPKNACIACHRRGGKKTCPHCNERAHPSCLVLHVPECQAFQLALADAQRRLDGGTQ